MFRFFFFILSTFLIFNGLNAQSDAVATGRLTTQQLSPKDAALLKETNEVKVFAQKLALLKTAFADNDASRIVAYEAFILRGMQDEMDQMTAQASAESLESSTRAKIHLEKMTNTMAAFESHAFDPAKPEAAARDFAKLDGFLNIMEEQLEEFKKSQE